MPRPDHTRMTKPARLVLHDYRRSSASYRVRIALNIKSLDYEQVSHDLRAGEQRARDYLALNPQGFVPALDTGSDIIPQSGAIIEWLEEHYPQPALLPIDVGARAIVRSMAQIIACDIHPLNNLRVQIYLRDQFKIDDAQMSAWIEIWMREGFAPVEQLIARHGGQFAFGDSPTMADCYLVPQVFSAQRYGVALDDFPRIAAVASLATELEPFQRAHPDRQPA
jgi:maleylpyruvate isomerase